MTLDDSLPTTNSQAGHTAAATGETRQVNGRWERMCSNCGEWIGLGPKGGETSYLTHQRNRRCSRTRERKLHQEAKEAIKSLAPPLSGMPPPPPFPNHSPHVFTTHPSLASGPPCDGSNEQILSLDPPSLPSLLEVSAPSPQFASLAPSELDPLPLVNLDPAPSPTPFPSLLTPGSSNGVPTAGVATSSSTNPTSSHVYPPASTSHVPRNSDGVTVRVPCDGVEFKWEHGSLFLSYPLQYHETGCPTWSLDGIGELGSSHMVRLRSHSCSGLRDPSMESCVPCANIVSSRQFQKMLSNISKDPLPNTPYIYFNWKQLETKLRHTIEELQLERKQVWLHVETMSPPF